MHISVGAIIKNEKNEILMHERVSYPPGWALAAGHVDAGETPEEALVREVKEETNLDVKKYKLLYHEFLGWNDCKSGEMGHDWYLYEVIKWQGKAQKSDREAKDMQWVNIKDLKNLKIERVWKYWFKKLGYKI